MDKFDPTREMFGLQGWLAGMAPAALSQTLMVMVGYGAIGRPLSETLRTLGAKRFILIDPKRYLPRSVASQCVAAEVGQAKVSVGARHLAAAGAEVLAFRRDCHEIPAGLVSRNSIVIASADNRRADISASRSAFRMGARFLKLNVEPSLEAVSLRAYDYRTASRLCAECQFSARHYEQQRHPRSCDGGAGLPRTNSPRHLSRAAANFGSLAVLDLLSSQPANPWVGRECQYSLLSRRITWSFLSPQPSCRWGLGRRWPNLVYLQAPVNHLTMGEVLRACGASPKNALLRFCQQVSLRGRCSSCCGEVSLVRWVTDVGAPVAECSECGGAVRPVPYWTFGELPARQLQPVLAEPLAAWGVEPHALIEVTAGDRATSFVVAGAQASGGNR